MIAPFNADAASSNAVVLYAVLVSGAIGVVLGLVPLIAGIKKGKTRLGIIGLVASAVGGGLLGLILSLPASAIFTWLIFRTRAEPAVDTE